MLEPINKYFTANNYFMFKTLYFPSHKHKWMKQTRLTGKDTEQFN